MEFEITSVSKPARGSGHEEVSHLGNTKDGWTMTVQSAIKRIDSGQQFFFVRDLLNDEKVYLGVVRQPGRQPYIRAYKSGRWTDHLLAMRADTGAELALID